MFPVHRVWPKPSCKAQWKGEGDKADKGRGGKTTSGNGQAWSSASFRGQWTGKKWRKLVAKSSVVPQRPSRLRDCWWWWWWHENILLQTLSGDSHSVPVPPPCYHNGMWNRSQPLGKKCSWQVTTKHAYILDPMKSEWADYIVQGDPIREMSSHATHHRMLDHHRLSLLNHCGLILVWRVKLVCANWSPLEKKKKGRQRKKMGGGEGIDSSKVFPQNPCTRGKKQM